MSTSGLSDEVAADAEDMTDPGVSPCHARGVSPPRPNKPACVILVPLLPRCLLPSGPAAMTSVSFLPAEAIHSLSCDSSASR